MYFTAVELDSTSCSVSIYPFFIVSSLWPPSLWFGSRIIVNAQRVELSVIACLIRSGHWQKWIEWFNSRMHVLLFVFSKKKLKAFYGKWIEALYSCDPSIWEQFSKSSVKEIDFPLMRSQDVTVISLLGLMLSHYINYSNSAILRCSVFHWSWNSTDILLL